MILDRPRAKTLTNTLSKNEAKEVALFPETIASRKSLRHIGGFSITMTIKLLAASPCELLPDYETVSSRVSGVF